MSQSYKPTIAISLGDPNGIGPEIILKALSRRDIQSMGTYVIFAPGKLWAFYKKNFSIKLPSNQIDNLDDVKRNRVNVCTFDDHNFNIKLGESTSEAGAIALQSLTLAAQAVKAGKCDALVTAPINKSNIQSDQFSFPGHTEFLENTWGGKNLMFMVHENLKVGLVTQHIALKEVSAELSEDLIVNKLVAMRESLRLDFGLVQPIIAVLGLNPHAGDNGLLGKEEKELIIPTLQSVVKKGYKVFGPYPSDSFFSTDNMQKFDAVLAMYHDQGLIPFKTLAGMEGVNFTAGLPHVRTSPDHGVGYDIADKGIADEQSMVEAIYTANRIFLNRKAQTELRDNALSIDTKQRRR